MRKIYQSRWKGKALEVTATLSCGITGLYVIVWVENEIYSLEYYKRP